MSELVVKPSVMNRCVSSEQGIAKKLNNLSGEITSIQRSLSFNIRSRAKIDSQLTALAKVSQKNSQNSGQLAKVLSEAVGIYNSAENTVQGNIKTSTAKKGNKSSGKGSKSNTDNKKTKTTDWKSIIKNFGKLVGGSGTVGSITECFCGFYSAENSYDIGKSLLKVIGVGASVAGKIADSKLINLFGTASNSGIGFAENLAIQFDKFKINNSYNSANLSNGAKVANNVGAIAKWGGVALTGAQKFFGNLEEFNNDFSNPRMYLETIGETAVETGLGVLATAAVATILPVTAPAWAVAAGGAAVVMGVNYLSEKYLNTNIAEAVSDTVINGATNVYNGVKNIGKSIGDGIGNAGKAIAKWFNW